MKKYLALFLALVLALCLSVAMAETNPDDYYLEIKFSNVFQPTEWNYKASEKLAQMITERTEGHITVTYYGQNELDCYGDSVTQAVNGSLWMGLEEPSLFADYVGDCATLIGPMLYNTDAEYNYIMDSDIVADIKARLAEENIHVLDTHYSFGFRSVVTNRDIYKPEDLNGVKLRVTSSALFTKTVECLGATPTPMSFTECLSAISSGVVEGFEGSTSTLAGAGAPYELVKKVALTNHLIATRWLFMPEDLYQSIPEKWRNIIDECAVECGKWEQEMCANDEATQIENLKGHGVTWNEVDLDAFTAACAPVYDWIVEEYGADPELKDKLVAMVQEFRANNAAVAQ
ncbi:MAG: TRAP transporter substrate-binding protein DctP [Clostridia bacterium]|nr:TRAP transporter substrate-binding protein DctP [Clostridia bacterium]